MYTVIYNDYNTYPGKPATRFTAGYNFETGSEPAVLPTVNLQNNFSFTLSAGVINSYLPSTLDDNYQGYANTGVRNGDAPRSTKFGYSSSLFNIGKRITKVEWILNGGPQGNGAAQNELGEWLTYESLRVSDGDGTGIRLETIPPPSPTGNYTIVTDTEEYDSTYTDVGIALWDQLKISGSYNAAVFCHNQFEYTNDDIGTVYRANSLFELPERIDNIVSFIPDQRQTTTLTYRVRVSWSRTENWQSAPFTTGQRNTILGKYTANDMGPTGEDIHTITHTINNNKNNWGAILNSVIARQRSLDEQNTRYGQTFPQLQIKVVSG